MGLVLSNVADKCLILASPLKMSGQKTPPLYLEGSPSSTSNVICFTYSCCPLALFLLRSSGLIAGVLYFEAGDFIFPAQLNGLTDGKGSTGKVANLIGIPPLFDSTIPP